MMATGTDVTRDRIAAYPFPRGGVEVVRANRGYTLYSRRTEAPSSCWAGAESRASVTAAGQVWTMRLA